MARGIAELVDERVMRDESACETGFDKGIIEGRNEVRRENCRDGEDCEEVRESCKEKGEGMGTPWVKTPCVENRGLSKIAGCRIFTKLEYHQPSRSFKSRGIGNRLYRHTLTSPTRTTFYSCSAGNAGLAAATASTLLSQHSTVVVPNTTTLPIRSLIRSAGAHVIVHGSSILEADTFVRNLASTDPNGVYVSPFDHIDIWEGNSTLVDELYEQLGGAEPDAIVCSVGGGGLLNGVLLGLARYAWYNTTILAIETHGADSLARSLAAGHVITMPDPTSIAKSLGVGEICGKTWELVGERNGRGGGKVVSVVLSDAEAAMACVRYGECEGVVIEPACGVSLAGVWNGGFREVVPVFGEESRVAVIVCGGSTVSLEDVNGYATKYAGEVSW